MGESASVKVLTAEVRVVQVDGRQLTRSMYWQLDEAAPRRFEPFGRVKDNKRRLRDGVLLVGRDSKTGALVRYHAVPPDWSPREGPEEFAHWMRHWPNFRKRTSYSHEYPVATYRGFAHRWTVSYRNVCTAPESWHVRDKKTPESIRQLERVRQLEMRQQRCEVDLDELWRRWRKKAVRELAERVMAQAKYDEFKALPLIILASLK
jgi:hypothetical protein